MSYHRQVGGLEVSEAPLSYFVLKPVQLFSRNWGSKARLVAGSQDCCCLEPWREGMAFSFIVGGNVSLRQWAGSAGLLGIYDQLQPAPWVWLHGLCSIMSCRELSISIYCFH